VSPGLLPRWPGRAARRPKGASMGRHISMDTGGTAHQVTVDAAADGLPRGRYITVCGCDVLPAAMVTHGARHCPPIRASPYAAIEGSRR
jgi:hypothetical protein